jgi:hypothetical protein
VNVPRGLKLSAEVFKYWVIDREAKQIRIIMQTGEELVERIKDDDPILESEVLRRYSTGRSGGWKASPGAKTTWWLKGIAPYMEPHTAAVRWSISTRIIGGPWPRRSSTLALSLRSLR